MKKIIISLSVVLIISACNKQAEPLPTQNNITEELSAPPTCTGNTWSATANWPFFVPPANAEFNYVVFVIGNKLYAPSHTYSSTKKMFIYDGSTWSVINSEVPWPFSDGHFTCFSIGDKGYVIIDSNYPKFFEYASTTNTWTDKGFFPGALRYRAGSFVIGNKAYVIGGQYFNDINHKDVWEYDQLANQWTQKSDLPSNIPGRGGTTGFTINNKGYLVGGFNYIQGYPIKYFRNLLEYDPGTDSWAQKTDYPGATNPNFLNNPVSFTIGNSGYVGMNGSTFYKYSPSNNSWTQIANFIGPPFLSECAAVINSKAYVFSTNTSTSGMYKYTPKFCTGVTP